MQQHMQSFLSHFWNLWVRLLQSGILLAFLVIAWHRWSAHQKRRRHGTEKSSSSSTTSSKATRRSSIAFFHPHCSAGGGGERVLWKMVQVLGNLMERGLPLDQVIIYTVDRPTVSYAAGMDKQTTSTHEKIMCLIHNMRNEYRTRVLNAWIC